MWGDWIGNSASSSWVMKNSMMRARSSVAATQLYVSTKRTSSGALLYSVQGWAGKWCDRRAVLGCPQAAAGQKQN